MEIFRFYVDFLGFLVYDGKMKQELISITDAVAMGIVRLRLPKWAAPEDHIRINIIVDGDTNRLGPWVHLYCPFNQECNGRDPVDILITQFDRDAKEYVPYTGPVPESDEYKAKAAQFEGCLKN